MSFISKLDIVNACLQSMGETKLNTLEEDHTYKDDALDIVEKVRLDLLARSLWFNTEWLNLQPQATTKQIQIPQDVLKVDPITHCRRYRVAQRGRRLYNTAHSVYEFDAPVKVRIARDLTLEDLPHEAAAYIRDDSVLQFQDSFDGDNSKYQKIQRRAQESWAVLQSEHIRQLKANPLFARASVRVMQYRYGYRSGQPYHPHMTFPG